VEILAPAKINLFFEVLGRRDDGFHEIETLMVPIGLFDSLVLQDQSDGEVKLTAQWAEEFTEQREARRAAGGSEVDNPGSLPLGDDNLAVRAIRLLARRAGIHRGISLRLVKRIPMAAGLGGGSADAAAALVGANLLWRLNLSRDELAALAAELGSDVPFFLYDGSAVCRGRGEKIEPVASLGALHFVIVRPPEGLSTAAVYQACSPGNPPWQIDSVIEAWRRGDFAAIGPVAQNRLLEPARRMCPAIDELLEKLTNEGCPIVGMSGSGSSCFAVCRSAEHADRVANRLRAQSVGFVWSVRSA
jgi:4-diphosphocytidyl-2-C-methyl-D-erythritol kinase